MPAVGGMIPFSRASTALMTVAMELAASLWPIFGFTYYGLDARSKDGVRNGYSRFQ